MTICSYYLKGTCRFGDRCRYEHVDSEYNESYGYSNRRNDNSYGYQDRYRQQGNYQNRQNKFEDQDLSFGPRRYGNNERQYQNYSSQRYQQYSHNYEQSDQNEIYSSSPKHSYSSRYDAPTDSNPRGNSNYYHNKYGRNKYEWVSEDYKKRQQQISTNYEDSPVNRKYSPSQVSFSFKDTDYEDSKQSISEKTLDLAERIKEDIITWELGNHWLFTCYFPLSEREGFPGFSDISFEELRYEALKAKENNSYDLFVDRVNRLILDINRRQEQLKQPTDKMLLIIDKLRKGEKLKDESSIGGGFSFVNSAQVIGEPIDADEPPNLIANKASSFSFKLPESDKLPSSTLSSAAVNKASAFSFKDVLDKDTPVKSSASTFSFKLLESDKISSSSLPSSESRLYTPMEELSEVDREQFTASTFTLGNIPTVPPPKVLCFS